MGENGHERDEALAKAAKARAKAEKKRAKAAVKAAKASTGAVSGAPQPERGPSAAVRFAEAVRGILFLVLAVSMVVALVLSNQGYIVKLEDIFESLALVRAGRAVLGVIAVAFFIYGLKYLRAIR